MKNSELPAATKTPCDECPWRRVAPNGWLGPLTAQQWVELARSDEPIACHKTIAHEDERVGWYAEGIRQCRGAASFRANTCKLPRDPAVSVGPRDEAVFGSAEEFIEHHGKPLGSGEVSS